MLLQSLIIIVLCGQVFPFGVQAQSLISEDDGRFITIQIADGAFNYVYDSIDYVINNVRTVIRQVDKVLTFVIQAIATVVDVIIRQPANIVDLILYVLTWTLNFIVYIILDVLFHGVLEGSFLLLIWILTGSLHCLVMTIAYTIIGIVSLFRFIVLSYLYILSSILYYIIQPCLETVFWVLVYIIILVLIIWIIGQLKRINFGLHETVDTFGLKIIFFLPLVYATFHMWMSICAFILTYLCYPAVTLVYFSTGFYATYKLMEHTYKTVHKFFTDYENLAELESILRQMQGVGTILHRAAERKVYMLLQRIVLLKTKLFTFELVQDDYDKECVICLEEKQLITVSPCHHRVMCLECIQRLLETDYRCPLCRRPIWNYGPNRFVL